MATNLDLEILESQSQDYSKYSSFSVDHGHDSSEQLAPRFEDRLINEGIPVAQHLPTWLRYGERAFWILMPSFLHPSPTKVAPKPLHPSAWLDGLRGISALFVVCHHWSLVVMPANMRRGFMTDDYPMFLQLPIIRLTVTGFSAVCVFFVISGYALSYKPAKLTAQTKNVDFLTTVASSVFRRYLRLFLPTMATTLVVACLAYFRLFEVAPVPNQAVVWARPPVLDTFFDQMKNWWLQFGSLSDPLSNDIIRGGRFTYDPVLWTIPVEYDGSMLVFLTQIAFYRLRPRIRIFFNILIVAYAIHFRYWPYFLFLSGLCIATLHFHAQAKDDAHEPASLMLPFTSTTLTPGSFRSSFFLPVAPGKNDVRNKAIQIASFLGALWLLSYPEATAAIAPGYRTIFTLTPASYGVEDHHFWIPIAAVWLVFTVDKSPVIQPLFTNRYIQYLGRISYSIYIVHFSMIWLYGIHLIRLFALVTGSTFEANSASVSWAVSAILATIFFLPVTICLADFVQRYVDVQSVRVSAWLESRVVSRTR
ncbi:acyltransferase [Colletotrichum navitas]|uniref:Acyltransferase n=1 Tax=Colletotrichum navitas TaxID=681940 RepID=A0AAD8Q1R5_9PEZI|nr:acyltransferase [Colletotrichum navitas]KAK1593756.1 acyltransferase [Colletotrichum navitas]